MCDYGHLQQKKKRKRKKEKKEKEKEEKKRKGRFFVSPVQATPASRSPLLLFNAFTTFPIEIKRSPRSRVG